MLTGAQTDFLGNINNYPSHKPIFDNILSNFKPENPTIFKELKKEDQNQLINIALVCKSWLEWVTRLDYECFNCLNEDIHHRILSDFKFEEPTIHRRLEENDKEFLKTLARVNQRFRKWVFDPKHGLFKDLESEHYLQLPKGRISFDLFIGAVNQIRMKNSVAKDLWIEYVELVRQGKEAKCPGGVDPNMLDYSGNSPFSKALWLCKHDHEKYGYLIDQLFAAGLSDATLAKSIPAIFKWDVSSDLKFEYSKKVVGWIKTGNQKYIQQYLKPELKNILLPLAKKEKFECCDWLEEICVEFTVDALCHLIVSTSSDKNFDKDYWPVLKRLITEKQIPLDEELESGEHLIHAILNERDLSVQTRSELIHLILEKFPHEIDAKDKQGKRLQEILLIKKFGYLCEKIKGLVSEKALMDQREECHLEIKLSLARMCIMKYTRVIADNHKLIVECLSDIKFFFPSQNSFEKWLLECDEPLLHEIASWEPVAIKEMLDAGLITEEICNRKNESGNSVFEICDKQAKFFTSLSNADLKIESDTDSYACFNKKVKKLGLTPVIFDLFEDANRTNLLSSPLLKCLILLDPNVTDTSGNNLLHAFMKSNFCTVNKLAHLLYLLDHGVDPELLNKEGQNPLDIARQFNRQFAYPYLSKKNKK